MRTLPATTVVVVDDHPVFRDSLARAIDDAPDLALLGTAATAATGLELIRRERPDVAIVDVHMPGADGVQLTSTLRSAGLATRCLLISGDPSGSLIAEALRRGAAGFLTKGATADEVTEGVREVAAGHARLDDESQTLLVARMNRDAPEPVEGLTARELDVLRLTAEGRSTQGIAERLCVSQGTVKGELASIYRRLGVRDRAAAVAVAYRRGLIG